jgi:hypothetical protein
MFAFQQGSRCQLCSDNGRGSLLCNSSKRVCRSESERGAEASECTHAALQVGKLHLGM